MITSWGDTLVHRHLGSADTSRCHIQKRRLFDYLEGMIVFPYLAIARSEFQDYQDSVREEGHQCSDHSYDRKRVHRWMIYIGSLVTPNHELDATLFKRSTNEPKGGFVYHDGRDVRVWLQWLTVLTSHPLSRRI